MIKLKAACFKGSYKKSTCFSPLFFPTVFGIGAGEDLGERKAT
jgi:hypothetical protein